MIQLNDLFDTQDTCFSHALRRLDEGVPPPAADRIYQYLLTHQMLQADELSKIIESSFDLQEGENHAYQLMQLLELPLNLKKIAACCPQITQASVDVATDAILSFYHRYWRDISRYIQPDRIAELLRSRSDVGQLRERELILN